MSEGKAPDIISNASDKIADVSNAVSNIGNTATESVTKVTESVKDVSESIKAFSSTNAGTVVMMLIIGAGVAFITAIILYWLINRYINQRNSYLLPATKLPISEKSVKELFIIAPVSICLLRCIFILA